VEAGELHWLMQELPRGGKFGMKLIGLVKVVLLASVWRQTSASAMDRLLSGVFQM
jgi:hypothetical protein